MSVIDTIVLFDDRRAAAWYPFTWTRPAGELLFGAHSFRARAEAVFGASCAGHIAPRCSGFDEPGSAPVVDAADVDTTLSRLYLSSRAVPAWNATFETTDEPAPVRVGDHAAGWFAPPGSAGPSMAFFEDPDANTSPEQRAAHVPGIVVSDVWELVTRHTTRLLEDVERAVADSPSELPGHVAVTAGAAARMHLGSAVEFEPGVVVDCSGGPIWLDDRVRVCSSTRLAGPLYAGPGTTLLGGSLSDVSIGPACKVRGEVESSVILGYTNKAHDGFIGHSYIGRWVNLGALTTNSDLKNNYGTVRVATPDGNRDTGSMKVGCFLGDHVKTAIGTLLNTGTVVGPGANLFGPRMPAKHVRPFAWGSEGDQVYDLGRFLETARLVMARRDVPLTAGVQAVLEAAWAAAAREPAR